MSELIEHLEERSVTIDDMQWIYRSLSWDDHYSKNEGCSNRVFADHHLYLEGHACISMFVLTHSKQSGECMKEARVGFIKFYTSAKTNINLLWVHRDMRRKGYGSEMLRRVEKRIFQTQDIIEIDDICHNVNYMFFRANGYQYAQTNLHHGSKVMVKVKPMEKVLWIPTFFTPTPFSVETAKRLAEMIDKSEYFPNFNWSMEPSRLQHGCDEMLWSREDYGTNLFQISVRLDSLEQKYELLKIASSLGLYHTVL